MCIKLVPIEVSERERELEASRGEWSAVRAACRGLLLSIERCGSDILLWAREVLREGRDVFVILEWILSFPFIL